MSLAFNHKKKKFTTALAKERPADPIEYVANYLMKEKTRFNGAGGASAANEN